MRLFALALLATVSSFGQAPIITQGPFVGDETITRSSAVVAWVTDVPATTRLKWGYNPNDLSHVVSAADAYTDSPLNFHTWFLSGLNGQSAIYYQACSTANSIETCSPTNSFSTASGGVVPADPIPPTPVDAPVTPTGKVWTVGPDCNSTTDGLVAQWTKAARGDIVEIDPAITPYCAGSYAFPPKSPGPPYILTRVKNADSAIGPRRVGLADKPSMARFIHNGPNIIKVQPQDLSLTYCFEGEYLFEYGQKSNWAIYRCNNTNPLPVSGISSSGNALLTVPNHGIREGFMVHVTGVTGPGATTVNGDWKVHVVDSSTMEIHPYIDSGPVQATGPSSGGTIYVNAYQLVPVTEGQTPPSTCADGTWWHKAAKYGSEDELHRTWYCNGPDGLVPYRMENLDALNPTLPVIDLTSNGANYLMFQGLSFEPLNLKGDGSAPQYEYLPVNYANGLTFPNFITEGSNTHHIYWDQILASCPDPSPSGFIGRCWTFALDMSGNHWHVGGSYFSGFQVYMSLQSLYDGNSGVFFIFHTGPHELINNYMACAGICVFYPDDDASTSTATDLTFKQNTIETPDKYWSESPSWLGGGMYWSQRHRFEPKRLNRAVIDGNQFIGGWVWNNNAAAICLCTRGGFIGGQVSSINNATITTYPPTATTTGYSLNALQVNDLIHINNPKGACATQANTLFRVTSVISTTQITVSPSLGCTSSGGNIVKVLASSNTISDILISNNVFLNNPTDLYVLGHDSYPFNVGTIMRRLKLVNNLSIGLDQTRVGRGQYYGANPGLVPAGAHFNALLGNEDIQILNDTVVHRTGGFMFGYTSSYGMSSGLTISNNIFEQGIEPNGGWWNDGSWWGQAALDHAFSGATPAYTATNNLVLRRGGGAGMQFPYPAGTLFWDTNSGPFPFEGAAQLASRPRGSLAVPDVRIDAPLAKQGGTNGRGWQTIGRRKAENSISDIRNMGVDMDALGKALGKVSHLTVDSIGADRATITFMAPDSRGCSVDWSTSNFSSYTRVPNKGGAREQSVTVTGLPGQSKVSYRVNCAVERPTGLFSTP